jgi:hypothetical protein
MAGTGKSTIAKSVCSMLKEKGLLGGAFFCSRQIEECKKCCNIIPTIAYQLAIYYRNSTGFTQVIEKVLNEDPDIASKDSQIQVEQLLVDSWKKAPAQNPVVVVIDALDECVGIAQMLKYLIPAIKQQKMPGLKFFITSRPEQHITEHFNLEKMVGAELMIQHFYLHNVEKSIVKEDISKFLQHGLREIYIPKDKIEILVEQSGTLFIYAATVVKYVTGGGRRAKSRLDDVLNVKHTPEKLQTQVLDDLYDHILTEAVMAGQTPNEQKQGLEVLHTIIITGKPVSCQIISELLGYKSEDVEATVSALQSVLYINKDDQAIYVFHASFGDYLTTNSRAKDMYIDIVNQHDLLASHCLSLMESQLRFNICNLPSSFLSDNEVQDIKERTDENIGEALQYSSNFWVYHLGRGRLNGQIVNKVGRFVKRKMIFWIEAMSILGKLSECLRALDSAVKVSENYGLHMNSDLICKFCSYIIDMQNPRNESFIWHNQTDQGHGCCVQLECCKTNDTSHVSEYYSLLPYNCIWMGQNCQSRESSPGKSNSRILENTIPSEKYQYFS